MNTKKYLQKWLDNYRSEDPGFLDKILDESVVFYSPVVFKPIEGKDLTKLYLMSAGQSFNMDRFKYTKEIIQDLYCVLEFETFIDDISVNGADIITWNNEGRIVEFKVMIRSLLAIEKVKEKMVESLELYSNQGG
tara:strand:- start:530 stop:934 length:405 start_codon:yes stop_codon:yes gene_type:complete